jgi:ribosomal protein S18 acetylase RimI-like enzyme
MFMLNDENEFNIRSVLVSDRSRIANLIHFGMYVHQHLDWMSPMDWIGKQPYLVIENREGILATLACPPDLPEITWIRLFAVSSSINIEKAWRLLWNSSRDEFLRKGKIQVVALSMQSWFTAILETSKFSQTDNVIILINDSSTEIREPNPTSIKIRQMMPEDFPVVLDIDTTAFDLEWRNSLSAMELAFQQSSYTTIAEMDREIVGYQYSTSSGMGGHLARLAVSDSMQKKGIGYSLVHDVVKHFRQQGVMNITVNTQQSNIASLALYAKAGFKTTGESYRVYQTIL